MDLLTEIRAAAKRIEPHVRRTPVERAASFECDNEVWLKLENVQLTGSFKLRGVMNKLLSFTAEERARGFIASSTGNHGAAAAYAAKELSLPGKIVVPTTARPAKLETIRGYGAEIIEHGEDCVEAEAFARSLAEEQGMSYVSPYNDPLVAAGQGTLAIELAEEVPNLDAIFVAVGGGGMIAGVGCALAEWIPGCEVIGASPENSPVMCRSLEAGEIVDMESKPTLSDATAGGIEPGSITFEYAKQYVSRIELLSEDQIRTATRRTIQEQDLVIEGAAGTAVAAYLKESGRWVGKKIAIVLCGANIGAEELKEIL